MKLYTFEQNGRTRVGAGHDDRLIDLGAVQAAIPEGSGRIDPIVWNDMKALLAAGDDGMAAARRAVAFFLEQPAARAAAMSVALSDVRVRAPLPRPGKVLCSGINYHGHLKENPTAKLPDEPFFFNKLPNAVVGPDDPIILPPKVKQLDYEVELAVVIGRTMKNARAADVMDGVAGYTILHDVSARDVQFKDSQIALGKNFDTFCPLGPCLVTKDEIPHPETLRLRSTVNGTIMQDGSNTDWVFPLPVLLSFLTSVMTLEPGDVVSTGTPAGVGYFRAPQVFLKHGDDVILEIDGIGTLRNGVIAAS